MKKLFAGIIGTILFLAAVPSVAVRAATIPEPAYPGEHIGSYAVEQTVRQSGVVEITERIQYVFDTPRHGIIRKIPYVKTNADGKSFRLTIDRIRVTDENGNSYRYDSSTDGRYLTLKIGDPDRTVTGTHAYDISYDVSGAVAYFPDHDELYWNSIGTEWDVPVLSGRVTVELPSSVAEAVIRSQCYTGAQGSTASDCTASVKGDVAAFQTTKLLGSGEGLTTVVGFPKGYVAVLEPKEVVPFFATTAGKVTLVLIVLFAVWWYLILPFVIAWKWWKYGRDPTPPMGEAKAWFSPPQTAKGRDLTPAETGALVDESVDNRDMFAAIVDLARRGFLTIIGGKNGEFELEKKKDWESGADVLPYERTLLDGIFAKKDLVKLRDLDLVSTIGKAAEQIYASMVSDGFFVKNPKTTRDLYTVLGVFAAITLNPLLAIAAFTFGRGMPRKTIDGAQAAAVGRSLKNFLMSQDKQLAFQAKNQMMFEKLLPYAVAFGVEVIWAKRFADVVLKQPDWYVAPGSGRFTGVAFARSIGTGYSKSFAYSATYHSSSGFSSGFSSGGGFSGGGGGGGGGGSW